MSTPHGLRPRIVRAVYAKEIVDTLRDRRTLLTMVLVPMVTYPLMLIAASEAALVEKEAAKGRTLVVAALDVLPAPIAEALRVDTAVAVVAHAESSTLTQPEQARRALEQGAVVAIGTTTTASAALAGLGTAEVRLYYDETESVSRAAVSHVEALVDEAGRRLLHQRLDRLGLGAEAIEPVARQTLSISTRNEVGGELASRFLPMLILVFIAISCFYPAIELTAGEKERGTLATLLTAPVLAAEIVAGKYLAVVTIGVLAGLLNVSVITLTLMRALAGATSATTGEAALAALPQPTTTMVVGLLAAVLLVAAVVGAVMMVAATFARSFRDANNLLTPVLLVVMAPAFLASFPSAELDARWAAVPIAGTVLWMKALLVGKPVAAAAVGVVGASLGASVLLLGLATRIFGDERVLFASEGRRADARALLLGAPELGPGAALAFASVLFIGNYFLTALLTGLPPLGAVLVTQLVLHVGLALAFVRWARAPELLALGRPDGGTPQALGLAGLVGGGAWIGLSIPLMWAQGALVPGQGAAAEAMKSGLSLEGVPLPILIAVLAIVPAVAEELAFRGVVLGALRRRMQLPGALVLQALLFALLHGSLFRLLPTFCLGLLLGLLAARTRSLWPAMLAHALNNTILVVLDRTAPSVVAALGTPTPWALAGAGAVVVALYAAIDGLTWRTSRP